VRDPLTRRLATARASQDNERLERESELEGDDSEHDDDAQSDEIEFEIDSD
jgi:hypothetical protein